MLFLGFIYICDLYNDSLSYVKTEWHAITPPEYFYGFRIFTAILLSGFLSPLVLVTEMGRC
jgi:hypothetical protein